MYSDRELLELAAKAYGLNGEYYKKQRMVREFVFVTDEGMIARGRAALSLWNPLADDGDAMRLAVKLGFSVQTEGCAFVMCDRLPESVLVKYKGGDVFAYVRRAIVRAAAAIGEAMQ